MLSFLKCYSFTLLAFFFKASLLSILTSKQLKSGLVAPILSSSTTYFSMRNCVTVYLP